VCPQSQTRNKPAKRIKETKMGAYKLLSDHYTVGNQPAIEVGLIYRAIHQERALLTPTSPLVMNLSKFELFEF